jgi:hypothetical protein
VFRPVDRHGNVGTVALRSARCRSFGLTRDNLSFVQVVDGELCHRVVRPTGDWVTDTATGQQYGVLFLPFLRINLGLAMLGWIAHDMIAAGNKKDGIVIGFFRVIAQAAAVSQSPPAANDTA